MEYCENEISTGSGEDREAKQCRSSDTKPCPGCAMNVCVTCANDHDCPKFCTECGEQTDSDVNSPMYAVKSLDGTYICHKCAWALKQ